VFSGTDATEEDSMVCSGASSTRPAGGATSKMKDKAAAAAAAKTKTTAKEKEPEKQSESVNTQFNTAMPHWILRIVSDADVTVSSVTSSIGVAAKSTFGGKTFSTENV